MKNKLRLITALLSLILFTSCEKYLEAYSPNLVTIRSLNDLDEVLIGSVYVPSKTMTYTTSNVVAPWLNYIDDDVNTVIGASTSTTPIGPLASSAQINYMYGYTTWQYDVSKSYDKTATYQESGTWKDLYSRINICNIILNEIEQLAISKDAERADYHRIKGEALFLRAQFYFFLTNIYGQPYEPALAAQTLGVPLKLTHYIEHQNKQDQQFERASLEKIYAQLKKDLEEAITHFDKGSTKETHFRTNAKAARILLSRIGLFTEDYELAKLHAEEVINSGIELHNLPTSGETEFTFFSTDNPEVLFSQGSLNFQTSFSGAPQDFCISKDLVDSYKNEDKRLRVNFGTSRYSDSLVMNRKYQRGLHISYFSDQFLIRNSEAYLNAAEAYAMLNDDTKSNYYLNLLKKNRITGYLEEQLAGQALINEIRAERRRELCFEGHRWFDIRRYSVNSRYPYSRPIVRTFGLYTNNGVFIQKEEYILKAKDPAYTFQIPADVREFQPGMPVNQREVREPSKVTTIKF